MSEFDWIRNLKVEGASEPSKQTIDRANLRNRLKALLRVNTPEARAERARIQAELQK